MVCYEIERLLFLLDSLGTSLRSMRKTSLVVLCFIYNKVGMKSLILLNNRNMSLDAEPICSCQYSFCINMHYFSLCDAIGNFTSLATYTLSIKP